MPALVSTLLDGEPFDDWDGFLYDYGERLSLGDLRAIEEVTTGQRESAYIGGGHLPVWFICTAEPLR